ncbi:MAG TPA: hypothetical protein VGS41_07125 [Chthonomonadales bacterium]|nr:hypothetical protein [Chthonomonadales bacterium]
MTGTLCRSISHHARRLGPALAVAAFLFGNSARIVRAQGAANNTGPSAVQEAPPKDVATLIDELDDIDRLTSLNALNLTADQLDKLISAIQSAQTDYFAKVNVLGKDKLLKLSDEIKSTRKKALQGAPVPADFTTKIQSLEASILKQRDALNAQNIQRISDAAQAILTKDQIAAAVKLSRDAVTKLGGNTKSGTDTQWLNYYLIHVIIDYPRIIPLLKDMKTARA